MNNLHPAIASVINPFVPPVPDWKKLMATESFNDDDVYVFQADSFEFVKQYSCCLADVRDARAMGFKVGSGNTWAKGMQAKRLGLWCAA